MLSVLSHSICASILRSFMRTFECSQILGGLPRKLWEPFQGVFPVLGPTSSSPSTSPVPSFLLQDSIALHYWVTIPPCATMHKRAQVESFGNHWCHLICLRDPRLPVAQCQQAEAVRPNLFCHSQKWRSSTTKVKEQFGTRDHQYLVEKRDSP